MTLTPPANAQGGSVWRRQKCYTPQYGTWTPGAGARALASGAGRRSERVCAARFRGVQVLSRVTGVVRIFVFARARPRAGVGREGV